MINIPAAKANIEQVANVYVSDTGYNAIRTRDAKTPYWKLMITTPPLPYVQAMELSAKFDSFYGGYAVFQIANPFPPLSFAPLARLKTTAEKDATTIEIDGLTVNSKVFYAGEFIQFPDHSKVYRIVDATDTDSSGTSTVTITPQLIERVLSGAVVNVGEDVVFNVSLKKPNEMEISTKDSKYVVFDLEMSEQK